MNAALRTIVALTIRAIDNDHGYVPTNVNPVKNTHATILKAITLTPNPVLDDHYWSMADLIIDFFRTLDQTDNNYKAGAHGPERTLYAPCIELAKADEVTNLEFGFAVQMPYLYGRIAPKKWSQLDASKTQAKILKTGEYMGSLNKADRFFVKLVSVGAFEQSRGGNIFEIEDRNHNIGFFFEPAERLVGKLQLGDCFAIHATPAAHRAANGEKHTIFRSVQIVDNKGRGNATVDPSKDSTGLFI